MLILVWTNSSVCSDNTKSHLADSIWRNSKALRKHQHVTSKHNTDQSKTQNTMNNFLFSKQNPTIARSRQMTQFQKKKKKWQAKSGKKKTHQKAYFTSVLTIAREMAKTKGKNPDKMCQLIFLKIYPQQQKESHKNPLYIYWECQTIYSTSYLKLLNTHLLHLFVDMYISKCFFF